MGLAQGVKPLEETEAAQLRKFKHLNQGAWVITYGNRELGLQDDVGRAGPRGITITNAEILGSPDSHEFRMFEDGEEQPDYRGMCYLPEGMDEEAFNPLDNFGGPNTGCVLIQYRNKETGKWEVI